MQYDVNNGLLQVVIDGEEINAVVGEAAQIDVGEAINYIQSGKAEIEEAVEEGISDFNENATEKTNEFDLNAQNKTSDFNSNATQKTLDFNSNASEKTDAFNLNAQDKTSDFNANAIEKTNDFNSNAQDKTGDFNDNAVDKTNDFNDNATDKTGDFNLNAQNKTSDFNDNYTEKKGLIDAQVVIAEGAATTATNQAGLAKQWAIGDPSEPTGNSAKYWATQASNSATAAATSEDHAEVWAEGTDQEVQALGGVHSSKGWAAESAAGQINSNWTENDPTSKAYIQNKPTAGDNISLANNQISAVSDASPTQNSTNLVQSGGVFTATNNLQTQIDAIVSSSDVFDIVGTYAELQAYDISTVPVNDIIKVLVDSTHDNAATYYRCVESGGVKSWSYVGAEGAYYTKGEADSKFSTIPATGSSLDYTGTTLSLENAQGTVLSSVTIKSTPDLDNKSITLNGSSQLQTVGVINSRDTSTAVKTWTGTKAQYDAIVTKDPNTLYNITDDTDVSLTILEVLYPVGSVYITTANTCPLSTLISGSTWELVSSGRVLQGADSGHSAGTTIEAGLPNITGTLRAETTGALGVFMTEDTNGAFGITNPDSSKMQQGSANNNYTSSNKANIDASRSNPIYGNSTTVQPPAYVVNIYRRTA